MKKSKQPSEACRPNEAWQTTGPLCHSIPVYGQGQLLLPKIDRLYAYGAPASAPALADVWTAWEAITQATDPWLDALTVDKLQEHLVRDGKPSPKTFG